MNTFCSLSSQKSLKSLYISFTTRPLKQQRHADQSNWDGKENGEQLEIQHSCVPFESSVTKTLIFVSQLNSRNIKPLCNWSDSKLTRKKVGYKDKNSRDRSNFSSSRWKVILLSVTWIARKGQLAHKTNWWRPIVTCESFKGQLHLTGVQKSWIHLCVLGGESEWLSWSDQTLCAKRRSPVNLPRSKIWPFLELLNCHLKLCAFSLVSHSNTISCRLQCPHISHTRSSTGIHWAWFCHIFEQRTYSFL